ncbi:hypothetical protein NC653_028280 [Populus alba x Populus x berolinensis]|uniref:Uncharacterized protein n=1 Tax=Populus alba x Populus x berolinensis TaxID=444605 RepID=A0AAD6M7K3_9ROSI|nr:hypothetical protein NC653_028280 [Populus alba x Populus x berolinensis]
MECTDKGTFDPIDTGPYHIVWWCHLVIIHFVAATKCNVILVGRLCLERFQMEFVEEGYFKCCREGFLLILSELISTLQVTSTTVYLSYILV